MPPGDSSGVEPPVPIPNTEVKLPSADDTARATGCGKYVIARGLFLPQYGGEHAGWSSGSSSGS